MILLDAVNTAYADQGYARRQMLSFIQQPLKPGQRVAVFTLRVLQDFTSDPQVLAEALQRYKPQAQEFATAGRAETSAAVGSPTVASTVTALDAGAPPSNAGGDTSTLSRSGVAGQLATVQAALSAFADRNQLRLAVEDNHTGLVGSLGAPTPQ